MVKLKLQMGLSGLSGLAGLMLLAGGAGASAGCVTGGSARPSKPVVEFPPAQALAELEARPAAPPSVTSGPVPADGWRLAPSEVAMAAEQLWQPAGAWESAFAAVAAAEAPQLPLTQALSCGARELGRFLLATGAPPPESLQQFMFGACGVVVPQVGFATLVGDVPAAVTDAEVLRRWGHQMKSDLLAKRQEGATEGGFWFGRARGKAIAVFTYAQRQARLARAPLVPDANGDVVLEGELLETAEYVSGYVNQGRFGVESCAMDPAVARPRFRAVCHVAQSDAVAWLQLLYARPKRVLARPFLQILVRRPAAGAGAGAAPTAGAGAPSAAGVASAGAAAPFAYDDGPLGGGASGGGGRAVADATGFAEVVLAELNRVRVQAGLGAVKLSAAQSAVAARVAGHYFVAAEAGGGTSSGGGGGGGEEMDRIALGLLAGWQVGGMIRDGQFLSWLVPHTRDPARWLASALAMPLGRATLLAREIEEVALGPLVLDKPEALGAVVTGYRFHRESDHAADIRRLYQRLLTARKRLGLKLPARLEGMDRVLAAELARVHAGKAEPANAMQAVLQIGVDQFGGGMRGYVIETTSLDALEIPEQIVRQPTLHLEIGVTHHKPAGAAWAQLVIVVIFADYGPDQGGQRI